MNTVPSAPVALPERPASGPHPLVGGWNIYFILKLLLYWRGLIDFHALENLVFFLVLALPVPHRSARLWRHARQIAAVPLALALLYYDSYLPPIGRLIAQAGVISDFSLAYLVELGGRFVSGPVVALLAGAILLLAFARRFIRLGVVVLTVLVALTVLRLFQQSLPPAQLQAAALPKSATLNAAGTARLSEGGSDTELNRILEQFYADQARRIVHMPKPAATELPFDLLFIHVCSLSWSDMEAVGLQLHPLWRSFDIVFRKFNAAASYSGPAAVRLNRANCGQSSNDDLYKPVSEQCYLMPSLKRAGYDINLAMNHDGHFDDFLPLVRQQGVLAQPLPLTGILASMKGFDDSPIHDDGAVLARWRAVRATSDAPRTALYYNTISLHDGNRLNGAGRLDSIQSYRIRLTRLFDEMEALMQALASGSRRTVVVLIPEHGAALRGDRMQIAGLREIPTPSITTVPVGIRIIEPGSTVEHDTEYVDNPSSFVALSQLIARMLEHAPFGAAAPDGKSYVKGLPTTEFVAENQSVVMRVQGRLFWREEKSHWRPFETEGR